MEEININKGNKYYYLIILACCTLSISSVGIISNCLSIFIKPISQSLNIGIGDVSLVLTITSLCSAFFGPILNKLVQKFDIRILLSVGISISTLILFSFSFFDNITYFYIASILLGISLCCFSLIPVTIIIGNWFKDKYCLIIGFCLSFTGIGGAIFNPLFNKLILYFGWRKTFMIMAFIIAIIALPCSIFIIRLHPKEINLSPYGENKVIDNKIGIENNLDSKIDNYKFILVLLFSITIASAVSFNSHISNYALSLSFSPTVSATMISCAMVGNILSKLLLGYLSDKIGAINSCSIFVFVGLFGLISFSFLDGTNIFMAYFSSFLYGVIFAPNATGIPLIIRQVFGSKNYSKCYSIIAVFSSSSYALSISLIGYAYDYFSSYNIIIYSLMACMLTIIAILFLLSKPSNKYQGFKILKHRRVI